MQALHRAEPRVVGPLPGPKSLAWLRRDQSVMSPSYTRTYPLVVKRGLGAVIQDMDDNLFLDFTAGIAVAAAGHCHPRVTAAIRKQAGRLVHMSGTDFYYRPQILLAEKLAKLAPGPGPKRVFFTNSGAESNEAALKLARYHTRRTRVIAFFGAFHGRTYGALSLGASKPIQREGFAPLVPDIHHAHYGDAESVRHLLRTVCPPSELAAIFVEPIQGEGGYVVPPPQFLPELRRICDETGALLVLDEVQAGWGRTGKLFAQEHFGVHADVTCLAKGIANGLPLGAIVARADRMNWKPGSHASTFGGNPVACAAALATLELLLEKYMRNAARRGDQLIEGLRRVAARRPEVVHEVRGVGLMVGMEVRLDGQPSPEFRDLVVDLAFERGLLLLPCGKSTVRFCPPLCVNRRQVEIALELVEAALAAAEARRSEFEPGTGKHLGTAPARTHAGHVPS